MLSLKAPKQKRIQLPSNTPQHLYTQNDVFAGDSCAEAYTLPPRRRLSICIRKMMFSLGTPAQKRIHRPSQTHQLLYTQNDVFAEDSCAEAYTLSAQCTCFRSKLLSRSVYSSPPIRPSICIRKMMFSPRTSARKRIQLPSNTPQLLYTQNDVFAEAFCTDARYIALPSVHAFVQSS